MSLDIYSSRLSGVLNKSLSSSLDISFSLLLMSSFFSSSVGTFITLLTFGLSLLVGLLLLFVGDLLGGELFLRFLTHCSLGMNILDVISSLRWISDNGGATGEELMGTEVPAG